MFPLIYSWLFGDILPNIEYTVWTKRDNMAKLYNDYFYLWSIGDCDVNGLSTILNNAMKNIITDSIVLTGIAENNGKFDKNLLHKCCLCGSGRRFNKCHGKAYK